MPETKILHVSDLHFGWGFDEPSWQNLCLIAENLRPDFLLVTGDLVNNPFFWEFSRAKQNLTNLKTRLEQKGASPELIVVPGNHDTRLFGLFPIRRLCPISIVFTAFALLLGLGSWLYLGWNPLFVWSEIILISLAAFVFTLWCLCGNFRKYFRDFLLPDPTVYNRGHVDIVFFTFDSATVGSAARGEISKDQLITAGSEPRAKAAKKALEDGSETRRDTLLPYGIALLHHHPLPIPYDTRHERLLVLQNAGAFLNEVSRLKIRLILHGHKHHRHFSRITINAGQDDEFEVGVLSTGTPTAGTKPPHFGYNFNFLQLDDNWDMRVTPYEGSGGTFKKLQPFIIENAGLAPKRVYESFLGQYEAECDLGVSVIEIDQDGDAYHKEEYRGFKIIKDGYTTDGLREPISVGVEPGHIELFSAGPLDDNCPLGLHLSIDTAESTLRHQKGQIKFGRSVSAEYRPFNFFFHYHALNAFAMSAHQYREMYKTDVCTPIESTTMYLKGTPFKEIVMILKFPAGFKILGKPELIIENATGTREDYLEQKFGENLFYSPQQPCVFSNILSTRKPEVRYSVGAHRRSTSARVSSRKPRRRDRRDCRQTVENDYTNSAR